MINFLTSFIEFLIEKLYSEVEKLDKKANSKTEQINVLIHERMALMERSGKAKALANNLSKSFE